MPPFLLLKLSQILCKQLWQPLSRWGFERQHHLQLSRMLTSLISLQVQAGENAAQAQRLQALFWESRTGPARAAAACSSGRGSCPPSAGLRLGSGFTRGAARAAVCWPLPLL